MTLRRVVVGGAAVVLGALGYAVAGGPGSLMGLALAMFVGAELRRCADPDQGLWTPRPRWPGTSSGALAWMVGIFLFAIALWLTLEAAVYGQSHLWFVLAAFWYVWTRDYALPMLRMRQAQRVRPA